MDPDPRRWRILGLVSVAELLGMSLWFTANAVAPHLQRAWSLDTVQTGWLATMVQIGFVAGTWMGRGLTTVYGDFFHFPFLIFTRSIDVYIIAALISAAAAIAGALKAVLIAAI